MNYFYLKILVHMTKGLDTLLYNVVLFIIVFLFRHSLLREPGLFCHGFKGWTGTPPVTNTGVYPVCYKWITRQQNQASRDELGVRNPFYVKPACHRLNQTVLKVILIRYHILQSNPQTVLL